jgi:SAM-dependent methyltransferase
MAESLETFQISLDAAETYEAKFVPALFGEWAPHLVTAAGINPGDDVLDVACGTGVVARAAADLLGGTGTITGVDINDAMLAVARRRRPDIAWRTGDACDLPIPDRAFDVVTCQAALMFMPDPAQALREMARVMRPGGTVALQVWAALSDQPAYSILVDVAARHAGPDAVELLSSYWTLGDLNLVRSLAQAAGLEVTSATTRTGTARFDSIDELVRIEVEATPLVDRLDDDLYRRIRDDARQALAAFETTEGLAEIPIAGHIVIAGSRNATR